jgi:nudix-type nucleoside diphosphatase (YffH/AdpP family)
MTVKDRLRIHETRLLSDNWYVLKTTRFDWKRRDGVWQIQNREHYDRGNGAVLLPYNPAARTVLLVRQFRLPAYLNGYDDLLIEAAAGLLDDAQPEVRIRAEVEEELGYRLGAVRKVFEAFMSPGSVTEILHFFVAEYDAIHADRRRRRPSGRGRGHRGAGADRGRGPGHDRRRPHPRRQNHHAVAAPRFDGLPLKHA